MNHLEGQKSPYLLQHASNPVDWYPWGEEAFQKARLEDKPIFLSIGYSTCHWCHVMETESFANQKIGALMNEVFVSIKVDREERPDLDNYFMEICQVLTGGGGWPLTIVMTAERTPFFAANYIPGETAYGRMGMVDLVPRIAELWKDRRAEMLQPAESIKADLDEAARAAHAGFTLKANAIHHAALRLGAMFDSENGGFGGAPKFPMPTFCLMLLRAWSRAHDPEVLGMVEQSLHAMRNGGIYDQIGLGFHRYSTDARWLVPHFEKMLYDQALLALAYTEAWQATGKDFYRQTAREILSYGERDLTLPGGGFATAEDADSEGEEGKFYLWKPDEVRALLGEGSQDFLARYKIEEGILHRDPSDSSLPGDAEARLLDARSKRVRPLRDDKILTDWNGLMIAAFARAGSAFDDPRLIEAGAAAARFTLKNMSTQPGRLLHRYRDGDAAISGFADDYAFLSWGLLELFQATGDVSFLEKAILLIDSLVRHFWDAENGGFFQTADDAPDAVFRHTSLVDGVVPSANAVGLHVLVQLNRITGKADYEQKAESIARRYPPDASEQSNAYSFFLAAADTLAGSSWEVVIAGDPAAADTRAMLRSLRQRFLPHAVVIPRPSGAAAASLAEIAPFTGSQEAMGGRATAYVCTDFICELPTTDIAVMLAKLGVK